MFQETGIWSKENSKSVSERKKEIEAKNWFSARMNLKADFQADSEERNQEEKTWYQPCEGVLESEGGGTGPLLRGMSAAHCTPSF